MLVALSLVSVVPLARALLKDTSLPDALGQYSIRVWQHEDGLPDNSVPALLQMSDGYLWIGTRAGLARYDGVRFVAFNRDNTPQMVNEVCWALAEDHEGGLWVGTEDGLLCRRAGVWQRYTVQDGLPTTNVWTLCATRNGDVWIGTGGGLARFQNGTIEALTRTNEPGPCKVLALHEDADGSLWIGTSRGLFRRDRQTGRFDQDLKLPGSYNFTTQVPDGYACPVSGVFRDPTGRVWLASNYEETYARRMHLWDGRSWTELPFKDVPGDWEVRWATEADGTVWFPRLGSGLWRDHQRTISPFPLPIDTNKQCPLALAVDREGSVWAGMFKAGLFRLSPQRMHVLGVEEGLPHELTWTVCEARDGSVWIGTDGGLCRWKEGNCTSFTQTNGLSRNEVRALAETSDGTIWVGTLSGLDAIRDGQITHVRFPGEWFETKVRALLAARNGALWVGTVRGLTRLHNGERTQYAPADGLGAQEVRALLEDHAGNLWVGTYGGGLTQFVVPPSGGERDVNGRGTFNAPNRLKPELRTRTTTDGLSSTNVWALHEDADGVLWIGTDRGLNRLKDGQITVFTTREGLPDDLVNVVTEDDVGRLWIGHDRGIYWVAKQDFEAVATGRARSVTAVCYDETDGLRSREVNGQKSFPAACKTRDGRLWIATARGVAIINPAKVSVDATPPGAIIEEIRANGETVFDNSRAATNLPSDFALHTSPLRLPPGGGRVLELRYTAGAFVAPEKVRFRYRMTGLSPSWIDVGTRREVFFTDLRPGNYEFELLAANHHGVWPERGTRMTVHLSPHLYETAWFWPAVVVLAIAGFTMAAAWRFQDLQQRHALEQQAALARERDRIARDMHDDLGAGLTRLVLTGGRVATTTEQAETRTAIQRLSGEAAELLDQLGDLVWCTNHQFDTLDSLLARLREHAATFLDEAGLKVCFDLPPPAPTQSISGEFRRQTFLLFKEVLTNIARHARASEVQITIRLRPSGAAPSAILEMVIADNGQGFDPEAAKQAHGNGLTNLRTRAATLGGSLELQTSKGHGTTIRVELPLHPHGTTDGGQSASRT